MHVATHRAVPLKVLRRASGQAPSVAPPIVHEVLLTSGRPLPDAALQDMEDRLRHNFADVRIHTDDRAAESARVVGAHAYTVGRHIVFAAGSFDPWSLAGRRLLGHELTHAAASPPMTPTPSGTLRISSPADADERHAARTADADQGGRRTCHNHAGAADGVLMRQAGAVAMTGFTVNHDMVTVPPEHTLSFSAVVTPANATGVALSVTGTGTTIAPGTTIDNTTGRISVDAAQTGGAAQADARQTTTLPDGSKSTTTETAPFNFTAVPVGIASSTGVLGSIADAYGGDFTHTFSAPSGSAASAIERAHVNEKFSAAGGTALTVRGSLGTLTVTVTNPDSTTDGWDLDSTGTMAGPDHVSWSNRFPDARPFVANASNRAPAHTLPQDFTATQGFRNLSFPSRRYGTAIFTSTTHRRAIEDRSGRLKAVTSSNAVEVEEDYAGPTVFRRCRAAPASVPASTPVPPGGMAPTPNTTTVSVDGEGESAAFTFSIQGPSLGSTIDAVTGVLTVGTTSGSLTVRGGVPANFDETTVTVTAPVVPAPPGSSHP